MITSLIDTLLEWLIGGGAQTTVVVGLLLGIVYFRKAIGLGSFLADWVGRVIFSMGVLLILLVTGIVPGINVSMLQSHLEWAFQLLLRGIGWLF